MNKKLLQRIGELFEKKLQAKTGWGRNDVLSIYRETVREALMELLDSNTDQCPAPANRSLGEFLGVDTDNSVGVGRQMQARRHIMSRDCPNCGVQMLWKYLETPFCPICNSEKVDQLDDEHPLWLINEQIKGLLEGDGAGEDHESVVKFLRATGLPQGTVARMHAAIVHGDRKERTDKIERLRSALGGDLCPAVFKGAICRYKGPAETCDKTFECCRKLGNEINFRGRPSRLGEKQ